MHRSLFLILGLAVCLQAKAQITLTRADFPKPTASSPLPDSVLYSNVSNPGAATSHTIDGVNAVWNESSLTGNPAWQQFLPVSSTPLIFQFVFLGSDYAQPLLNGGGVAGGTLSDAYEYYDYATADGKLQVRGFGGNLLIPGQTVAIPLPAVYSSPDVLFTFPMQFGNTDSSLSGFNVTLPLGGIIGDVTVKRTQKRVNWVDAWGRITLPTGASYDVLRHVSRINRIDSLITAFFPAGFPSRPIEYRWLAQGMKIPVLSETGTRTGSGNNTSVTINAATYLGGWPTGVSETMSAAMKVFPNPAQGPITIEWPEGGGALNLTLYALNGSPVARFGFLTRMGEPVREVLPLAGLPAGTYILSGQLEKQSFRRVVQLY